MNTSLVQQNKEVVVGAFESYMTGNIEAFLAAMDPDVEIHEPRYLPYGGEYKGPQGLLELMGEAGKVLDLPTTKLISVTADEERTVVLMATNLLSNGEMRYITEHWCVTDGRVIDVRVFWFDLPS